MTGKKLGQRRDAKDDLTLSVQRPPKPAHDPKYQDCRLQIQTGDILLFRGRYFLSSVIEKLSDAPYSHIAVLARWNDRVVAFQADHRGVEVLPASRIVCLYNGDVDWWSLRRDLRPHVNERLMLDCALSLVGIKFGNWELIKLGWKILTGAVMSAKDDRATPDSLFCSQFVSRVFRQASGGKLDPVRKKNDISTSPGDFARSKLFEMRSRLFDGSDGAACEANLLPSRPGARAKTPGARGSKGVRTWTGELVIPPIDLMPDAGGDAGAPSP